MTLDEEVANQIRIAYRKGMADAADMVDQLGTDPEIPDAICPCCIANFIRQCIPTSPETTDESAFVGMSQTVQ